MDALAMGLCVAMIAFVRLPSLKVSCLLLSGLLIYDVFWVFFSAYIFNSNVMVKVATQPADNPLDVPSRKLHLGPNVGRDVPRLSLPGKLVFPSSTGSHFSMLGIGDIVMPGLLLCFVLRYDNYKKQANGDSCGASGPANISGRMQKVSYFHCTLIGYFVGKREPESLCVMSSVIVLQALELNQVFQLQTLDGRRAVTLFAVADSHRERTTVARERQVLCVLASPVPYPTACLKNVLGGCSNSDLTCLSPLTSDSPWASLSLASSLLHRQGEAHVMGL